jgi:hypothetical protein
MRSSWFLSRQLNDFIRLKAASSSASVRGVLLMTCRAWPTSVVPCVAPGMTGFMLKYWANSPFFGSE